MGYEATCRANTWAGQGEGKFQLETDEILFRADSFRLRIALKEVSRVESRDGVLSITTGAGAAAFSLGPKAEKLAEQIRSPKSRTAKMDLRAGLKVSLLGPLDAAFAKEVEAIGTDSSSRLRKGSNVIVLGIDRLEQLDRLPALVSSLESNGAIWVVHPKGKAGIKDTDIFSAGKRAGLVATKVARFSETHTAEKLVIPKAKR
ncbi:MAG: DUF3052 family protein [Gemmatimonadota bacterium]